MPPPSIPQWQLPPGVNRALWDYVHSAHIADDYDAYFAFNKLFELDERVLARAFQCDLPDEKLIADLGCGTGRALIPLVQRGYRGLAVDLSEAMLKVVRQKADEEALPIQCVRANLVELECIDDDAVDYAMCMFSTLGMIQGASHRQRMLQHVRRILKPGGVFVVHAHNYWYKLYDPAGPWWLVRNLLRSMVDAEVERGDKHFLYRGLPRMFLHVFTRSELRHALLEGGFHDQEFLPIDRRRMARLKWPWLLGRLRANGWIVVCR